MWTWRPERKGFGVDAGRAAVGRSKLLHIFFVRSAEKLAEFQQHCLAVRIESVRHVCDIGQVYRFLNFATRSSLAPHVYVWRKTMNCHYF
mmetsp:Transcript_149529/g.272234  ORF Transcript_149529/g.272234 Transcript_149529/m.272234 type:complete len:90 (+) Transcript_149529:2045-2314(+)